MAAGLATFALASAARGDEPLFGYVNTTDLLPQGKFQIEQWVTAREGEGAGRYHALEARTEVDYGLASNLQLTAYLNASRLDAQLGPVPAAAAGVTAVQGSTPVRVDSVTGEAIWRITSPYLGPVGLALLADATFGRDPPVLGLKAIAQKNLREDTLVLAANLRVDIGGREAVPAQAERPAGHRRVTRLEAGLGASYRFRPNWSAALELRARNRYAEDRLQDTAIFAGPSVHYGGQRWFLTLTALRRLHSSHRRRPPDRLESGLGHLAERTRWDGLRLRVGRTF